MRFSNSAGADTEGRTRTVAQPCTLALRHTAGMQRQPAFFQQSVCLQFNVCRTVQAMNLGQPEGPLLQCLERHVLLLLPAALLARLSCTCRTLHVWLSSKHTTPAWLAAAGRALPTPYLPLAPELCLSEVQAMLQREAAVQKQLTLGRCVTVVQVPGNVWSILAYSGEYFVCSKPGPFPGSEMIVYSMDTGLELTTSYKYDKWRVQFQDCHLLGLEQDLARQALQV